MTGRYAGKNFEVHRPKYYEITDAADTTSTFGPGPRESWSVGTGAGRWGTIRSLADQQCQELFARRDQRRVLKATTKLIAETEQAVQTVAKRKLKPFKEMISACERTETFLDVGHQRCEYNKNTVRAWWQLAQQRVDGKRIIKQPSTRKTAKPIVKPKFDPRSG